MEIIFDLQVSYLVRESVQIYIGKYVERDFEMQIFDRSAPQIFPQV